MTTASSAAVPGEPAEQSAAHQDALARVTGLILRAQTPDSVGTRELAEITAEADAHGWFDVAMTAEYVAVLAAHSNPAITASDHVLVMLERARIAGDPVWEALALSLGAIARDEEHQPSLETDRDLARATVLLQNIEADHAMRFSAFGQCANAYLARDMWGMALELTEASLGWLLPGPHAAWRRATAMYNLADIQIRRLCVLRQSGPDPSLAELADATRAAIRGVPLGDIPESWALDLHVFENLADAISPPAGTPCRPPAEAPETEFAASVHLAAALSADDVETGRVAVSRALADLDPARDPEFHLLALRVAAELESAALGHETAGLRLSRALDRQRVRTREMTSAARGSLIDAEELETEHARLRLTAEHDALTKVANRHGFNARVMAAVDRVRMGARAGMTLVLVDIDHFKDVNDTHGHEIGDEVLVRIAATLCSEVRDTDIVARWGGDEFILLLDTDDLEAARLRCLGIAHRVRQDFWDDLAPRLSVTVSIGLAVGKVTELDHLRESTDRALYRAKQAGRDGVSI